MWPVVVAALATVAFVLLLAMTAKWHAAMVWRADRAFFRRLRFRERSADRSAKAP
jgi:hypothetical protein